MAFLGDESKWAAQASECAADQNKFWEYHDKLFASQSGENQGAFNKDKLKGFAADLKLDTKAFDECLDSGKYEKEVEAQTQAAEAAGISSTPSFFVNDWPVDGALPIEDFDKIIAKAQQGMHPPPTPTPMPAGAQFYAPDPNRPGMTYGNDFYQGDAKAPVVVLSFEDFKNADAAKHFTDTEPTLKSKYIDTKQVRFVTVLFPVEAPQAAVAAVCAGRQNKFWEFRALLYQKQAEWNEGDAAKMTEYAKSLGLDEKAFADCIKGDEVQNQVTNALDFAQKSVGVPASPSYLVLKVNEQGQAENGKGYPGALPLDQFEQAIKDIQAPTPTPAPTATPAPGISKEDLDKLPVGVDADGNFYRGERTAAVKLVDFSDFQ